MPGAYSGLTCTRLRVKKYKSKKWDFDITQLSYQRIAMVLQMLADRCADEIGAVCMHIAAKTATYIEVWREMSHYICAKLIPRLCNALQQDYFYASSARSASIGRRLLISNSNRP